EAGDHRDFDAVLCRGAREIAQLPWIGGGNENPPNPDLHAAVLGNNASLFPRLKIRIKSSAITEIKKPRVRSQVRVNSISTRLAPRSTGTSICPLPSRVPARTVRPLTTT